MSRRLPPLSALRTFRVAGHLESFTRAAAELGVTHGAVSRQVANLEAHLGTALFRRTARRLALTEAGAILLVSLDEAFELLERGVAKVSEATPASSLTVSCIATFAMQWLIPRLHRFQESHPGIEVDLSSPTPPDNVSPPGTEVAIRITPTACADDMERVEFLAERFGPIVSPECLRRSPIEATEGLAGHILLRTASRPDVWAAWANAAGRPLPVAAGRSFGTFFLMLQAAASGLGVAIGPAPLVESDLAVGRLVAPLGFVPSGRTYCALVRRRDGTDPRIRAFLDWLLAEGRRASA